MEFIAEGAPAAVIDEAPAPSPPRCSIRFSNSFASAGRCGAC
jgi:hypothetical protein